MVSVEAIVGAYLLNALWQVPVLMAAAAVGARLLADAAAAYRHMLWVAALVLAAVIPLRTGGHSGSPHAGTMSEAALQSAQAFRGESGPVAWPSSRSMVRPLTVALGSWSKWATAGYALFLVVQAVRLGRAWRATRRLARRIEVTGPADVARARRAEGILRDAASDFDGLDLRSHPIHLRLSDAVLGPLTFGTRPAVIVLGEGFVASASDEDLRGALAHELAHVARRDYRTNLLCELLFLPISFHPAARLIRRRVAETREMACDEAAAALVGARRFGRTLLSLAASGASRPLVHAIGALDADILEKRMKHLLRERTILRAPTSRCLAGAALAMLVLGALAASASGVGVAASFDPRMAGTWKANMPEGLAKGKPAAEVTIKMAVGTPELTMVLYRHGAGEDGAPRMDAERPTVVSPSVEGGVLRFRTRDEQWRPRPDAPVQMLEADWEFRLVGSDEATIRVVSTSYAKEQKARGEKLPPPPPPFKMTRAR